MSNIQKLLVFGPLAAIATLVLAPVGPVVAVVFSSLAYGRWMPPGRARRFATIVGLASGLIATTLFVMTILRSDNQASGFALVLVPHIFLSVTLLLFSTLGAFGELRRAGKPAWPPFAILGVILLGGIAVIWGA